MAAFGFNHGNFRRYLDVLSNLGEREAQIHERGLADRQHRIVLCGGLKILGFRTDGISGGQESAEAVFAAPLRRLSAPC